MGITVALLLAAGSGTRLGGTAKAFVELGGEPMFVHSYRAMVRCGRIDTVVVLVPDGFVEPASRWVAGVDSGLQPTVLVGGGTRQGSVRAGLEAVPGDAVAVVCHDAARPFASPALYERVLDRLGSVEGVVPVLPSVDTVKRVRDGLVVETIPREQLGLAQTPQAFDFESLRDAHRRAAEDGTGATDDAVLLEAAGYRVAVVEGEADNFKVTTAEDLRRAEQVLAGGSHE